MSNPGIQHIDGMIAGLERVLDLRTWQHTLTATNLANADTPGFRARVADFDQLMAAAMERSVAGGEFDPDAAVEEGLAELPADPGRLDGNSVNREAETSRLAENSLMYNAVSNGLSRRLGILRFAASDGKA